MGRRISALAIAVLALSLPPAAAANAHHGGGQPPAIVSCAWLAVHQADPALVVVDVRTADEYNVGHIRDSVSIPFEAPLSAWVTVRDDLLLELPDADQMSGVLGDAGIGAWSRVVVVTSYAQPPYPQANATRVAETLRYAGVAQVSILDGGYPAWVAQGRETTTEVPKVTPVTYRGIVNRDAFVTTEYVWQHIGRSLIVDARDAAVYSGEVIEPWADKAGHIASAVSLPAPLIWRADGTFRSPADLDKLVRRAIGAGHRDDEVIVYCGVGGYASAWLYVLTDVLGYRNVKMYDGSAQEWVRYHDMVL